MSIAQLARTPGEVRALLKGALSDGAPWLQLPTATIAAILSCLDTKEAQLAEAKAVLRELEWCGIYDDDDGGCMACGGNKPGGGVKSGDFDGHAPGCRLAKVLRDET